MRFRTTVLQTGKTTTGVEVPPEIVESPGRGKRPAVTVTINGYNLRRIGKSVQALRVGRQR